MLKLRKNSVLSVLLCTLLLTVGWTLPKDVSYIKGTTSYGDVVIYIDSGYELYFETTDSGYLVYTGASRQFKGTLSNEDKTITCNSYSTIYTYNSNTSYNQITLNIRNVEFHFNIKSQISLYKDRIVVFTCFVLALFSFLRGGRNG